MDNTITDAPQATEATEERPEAPTPASPEATFEPAGEEATSGPTFEPPVSLAEARAEQGKPTEDPVFENAELVEDDEEDAEKDDRTPLQKRMDARLEPYKARLENITLGTAAIDTFLQIIEHVLEPLSKESQTVGKNPSSYETYGVMMRVVRRHALPELVAWQGLISGIDSTILNDDIFLQSQVIRACREQGLGDFLGEWLMLLGPVIR